jgi:hypothetical protein
MEVREAGEHQLAAGGELAQQEQHGHRIGPARYGRDDPHLRPPQLMLRGKSPDAFDQNFQL